MSTALVGTKTLVSVLCFLNGFHPLGVFLFVYPTAPSRGLHERLCDALHCRCAKLLEGPLTEVIASAEK